MNRYEKTIKEDDRYILTRVRDRKGYYHIWLLDKAGAIRKYSGCLVNQAAAKMSEQDFIRQYFVG